MRPWREVHRDPRVARAPPSVSCSRAGQFPIFEEPPKVGHVCRREGPLYSSIRTNDPHTNGVRARDLTKRGEGRFISRFLPDSRDGSVTPATAASADEGEQLMIRQDEQRLSTPDP